MKRCLFLVSLLLAFCASLDAQTPTRTPPSDQNDKIETEEIKVNMIAHDRNGNFVPDVKKDDLVITEDGRLHQANSVRSVVASVLIAMDNGGELRQQKNIATTRSVAAKLVTDLRDGTKIALMQFHDKVEVLSEWSSDRSELLETIENRTSFGIRSSFSKAADSAVEFCQKAPSENRHLILITDGLDTGDDTEARSRAIRKLWESGIVVHVISYTQMEYEAFKPQARIWREGEQNPKRMPEEVLEQLAYAIPVRRDIAKDVIKQIYQPRLFSLNIDRPFIKSRNKHLKSLATSQLQLAVLAEYTGGEFLLPESLAEIVEQAGKVSQSINSQYVVAYSPKRPLNEAATDEIRQIDITSKRPDLEPRASRRLVVFARSQPK